MPLEKQATVKFDPAVKAHREAAAAFLRRRAWNDSPIRFADDPAFGSVADQVEKKMLAFYMGKDKLTIPPPKFPATLVGRIVDGIVPKQEPVTITVTDTVINDLLMPERTKVAANDEQKLSVALRPEFIDIQV